MFGGAHLISEYMLQDASTAVFCGSNDQNFRVLGMAHRSRNRACGPEQVSGKCRVGGSGLVPQVRHLDAASQPGPRVLRPEFKGIQAQTPSAIYEFLNLKKRPSRKHGL